MNTFPSRVKFLIETVQTMHIPLGLRAHGPQLKPHRPIPHPIPQRRQAARPDILQGMLQARQQIGYEFRNGTAIEHGARNSLRDEQTVAFGEIPRFARVALVRALCRHGTRFLVLHRVDAAHTPICLDELALARDEVVAGRFRRSRQETPHHDRRGAQGEALDDVADVLDAAVGDAGDAEAGRELADVVHGRGLWAADGHDLLRDAGAAAAHTDTEAVDARGDEIGGLGYRNDVAADDVEARVLLLDELDHLDLEHAVALAAVQHNNIQPRFRQRLQALAILRAGADRRGADQLL